MPNHVFAHISSGNLFCRHCGAAEPMRGGNLAASARAMQNFAAAHAACPEPAILHEPPRPDRALPVPAEQLASWPGLESWLRHGEVGVSSKTLAAAITGLPLTHRQEPPLDAYDFGRCVGLLDTVPSLRDAMHSTQTRARLTQRWWHGLLDAWQELEALQRAGDTEAVGARIRGILAPIAH